MPFGLHGAPATFQHFINDILREHLDIFVSAYIDDLLIYSNSLREHKEYVCKILGILRENGLQVDIEKCEFHVEEVLYLGIIVGRHGIKMDPAKVAAVKEWAKPERVKDVQAFLGFANFYRKFIKGFSNVARPLTALTGNILWKWTAECQDAFENLKTLICTAPILALYDPDKECVIETDASDYVSAGVFSQPDEAGVLRPVAFFSKKHSPAECNYEIYDKELLAVVLAFEEWRAELEGSPLKIKVFSDHKNPKYFMTTKHLNRRQARWAEYLSRFDFKIHYRPGRLGTKPDALTRRLGDLLSEGDPRVVFQDQVVLKPHQIASESESGVTNLKSDRRQVNKTPVKLAVTTRAQAAAETEETAARDANNEDNITYDTDQTDEDKQVDNADKPSTTPIIDNTEDDEDEDNEPPLAEAISQAYKIDEFAQEILEALQAGTRFSKKITLGLCQERDGMLYYQDRLYIPADERLRTRICEAHHTLPSTGHGGRVQTLNLIRRSYFWPKMRQLINRYVRNCHTCSRAKSRQHAKYGVLKSLLVLSKRWCDLSVDFVVRLPESMGYNAIMVCVDRLTKMRHFIPTTNEITAEDTADLFVNNIYKLHGFPHSTVSDRGPQFNSLFWKTLCRRLGIDRLLSTAFHPETDG